MLLRWSNKHNTANFIQLLNKTCGCRCLMMLTCDYCRHLLALSSRNCFQRPVHARLHPRGRELVKQEFWLTHQWVKAELEQMARNKKPRVVQAKELKRSWSLDSFRTWRSVLAFMKWKMWSPLRVGRKEVHSPAVNNSGKSRQLLQWKNIQWLVGVNLAVNSRSYKFELSFRHAGFYGLLCLKWEKSLCFDTVINSYQKMVLLATSTNKFASSVVQ